MKPQYLERAVTEDLHEHVLVLHALWKTGIVTDAYTEARLDELADLCSRKASLQRNYCRVAVPVREWDREPEDLHFGHFGTQLVRLMSDKGISRAELAKRTGISMGRIGELERSRIDPHWSTVHTLARGLDVDLLEFLPRQSDG